MSNTMNAGGSTGANELAENDPAQRISPIFLGLVAIMAFGGWAAWTETFAKFSVFIFVFFGWIVSLCLHEYAHARTALWAGDRSVLGRGYLTLDPTMYVSPGLSMAFPLLILIAGGIGLPGGAVYIQMGAIRDPRKRSMVSLAGPAANLIVGIICALPFLLARSTMVTHARFGSALAFLITLQFIAFVLNLLPIPGLDGFGALEPFIPRSTLASIAPYRGYAPIVLFLLISRSLTMNKLVFGTADNMANFLNVPNLLADVGRYLFKFWSTKNIAL
jgi:Zn-dependent protease